MTVDTPAFNPTRLTLARKRRGKSQASLGADIGVDRRAVAGYETGEYAPSERTLQRIATSLDFPVPFFSGDDMPMPLPELVSFRSLARMTSAQKDMALSQCPLALDVVRWIEQRFVLPEADIPDLSRYALAEDASVALRNQWGWDGRPISNMTHLLESKGVRVFALSMRDREVDAFSLWHRDTPLVFLNTAKSAERSRFDAAHELAHLVLHRHSASQGKHAEQQANAFASAFLMPREPLTSEPRLLPTLPALIRAKRHWKVSLSALIFRLHALNVITDWQYRSLYTEITRLGYRTSEPKPISRESSQLLQKVIYSLMSEQTNKSRIAEDLHINESDLDSLIHGLAMTSLRGGRVADNAQLPSASNAHLKLVDPTE